MRVLHVVATGQRRGAEMFASDLVRALDRAGGYEQEVAVLRDPWPPAVRYEARVVRMPASGRSVPILRIDRGTLTSIRRRIELFRPDVVHAHGAEAFKYLAVGAPSNVPIVYRRIGTAPRSITRGMRRLAHAALLRRSDRVVAVAESVRRETIETFGVPDGRVVTIPRGVDPERLAPRRGRTEVRTELGVSRSAPVAVTVGALSPEKDPIAHLEVFRALRRSWNDLVYLFVGDGPLRRELDEAICDQALEPGVRVLGTRSDVGDLLEASDVLVLASRTEGMPGCVIEAGMAGVPAVAFGVAGVPEVVVDGVTGYVVPPGDHDRLAERVSHLLADPSRREEMGRAAREHYRGAYDITGIADRYVGVYAEVVGP